MGQEIETVRMIVESGEDIRSMFYTWMLVHYGGNLLFKALVVVIAIGAIRGLLRSFQTLSS